MAETVETFEVSLGSNEFEESARAQLFGELLKLAKPVTEHYLSDLYHDAMWLLNFGGPDQPDAFAFIVRPNGTHIYELDQPDLIERALRTEAGAQGWTVHVRQDERTDHYKARFIKLA